MSDANRAAWLAGHPIFGNLPEEQRLGLARAMSEHRFRGGETIFLAGDVADRMYLVVAGSVKITRLSEDGREALLNIVRQNDILGEIALLDNKARTASAIALADCHFLSLSRQTFHELLANPALVAGIFTVLVDRLRHMSELLHNLTLRPADARVPFVLGLLADRHGQRRTAGIEIGPRINQTDLGSLAHAARATVNRVLKRLERQGVIAKSGRRIVVRDRAGLDRAVQAVPARSGPLL